MSCYAGDTLVLATGGDARSALENVKAGTQIVIRKIKKLGFRVKKTGVRCRVVKAKAKEKAERERAGHRRRR